MIRGEVMRCEYAREAGAYVLGSLAPAERTLYERHLSVCPVCREEVAEIAVLPGLLGRLDATAASQIVGGDDGVDAPESRLPKLIDAAARSRRRDAWRRRWRMTGATLAAAGVAVFASLGLSVVRHADPTSTPPVALAAMTEVRDTPVSAEVGLVHAAGGSEVFMHCTYKSKVMEDKSEYAYRLVAFGADGTDEQVGSWMAGPDTNLTMSGITHYARNDIERIELQNNSGDPILVYDVPS